MSSKSFVLSDEVSNDSGVSSDTSRDSLHLLQDRESSENERETGGIFILLKSKEIEDEVGSDVCSVTSSRTELSGSKSLPIVELPSVKSVGRVKVGTKRKASLEGFEGNDNSENHKHTKRFQMSLKIPSMKPSLRIFKKMVGSVVKSKMPSIGLTRQSSELEVVEKEEVSLEIGKDSIEGHVSKNVSVKVEVSEEVATTEENGNLENQMNFSTSFDFDSSLIAKKQVLGKRKVLLDGTNDEPPNNKVKGGLYEQLKRPRIFSAESTSIKSSFECSVEELTSETKYTLPLVKLPQKTSSAFGSISGDTLVEVMNKHGEDFYSKYILVDCRYPYEFKGGHIKGAVNFYDSDQVSNLFFPKEESKAVDMEKKIPIFYCEFSQKRGPGMALSLRSVDRRRNVYPNVSYDELYVLDRGYKKFFVEDKYHEYCDPPGYVPMLDKSFSGELKKFQHHHQSEHRRVRRILSREKSSIVRSFEFKRRSLDFQGSD
uniref:M-phase inducer phosphatase n=1 Tax=Strongyloides stercoralis TaxID=6248 RepID=A0A0K0ERS3_STRER